MGRGSLCVETHCLGRSAGQLVVGRDRPSEEEKHSHPDVSGAYKTCGIRELVQFHLGPLWTMADGQHWLVCWLSLSSLLQVMVTGTTMKPTAPLTAGSWFAVMLCCGKKVKHCRITGESTWHLHASSWSAVLLRPAPWWLCSKTSQ